MDRTQGTEPDWQRETEGFDRFDRRDLRTRALMAFIRFAEALNRRCARFGNPAIYRTETFPWAAAVEQAWPAIRSELDHVMERRHELPALQDIVPDARSITTDENWKTFIFLAYGVRSAPNIALCPATWRALKNIPGMTTAMFSIFEPGKRLPPHRGPYNGVLRLHLGLRIPESKHGLMIRVADQCYSWKEGSILIFDDTFEHEAWNETSDVRVILFVDFVRPLRFPANLLNRVLLTLALFSPYVREGSANLRAWEVRFHKPRKHPAGHPTSIDRSGQFRD